MGKERDASQSELAEIIKELKKKNQKLENLTVENSELSAKKTSYIKKSEDSIKKINTDLENFIQRKEKLKSQIKAIVLQNEEKEKEIKSLNEKLKNSCQTEKKLETL